MSVAGITSLANVSTNPSNFVSTRRQDANQLFSALENGDLAGAQAAYTQLASLSKTSNGGPYTGPKLSSDFAAIGQALQNGDLTGAQEAALQFGQDLLAANQKLHGGNGGAQQNPSVVVNLSGLINQVNPNDAAAIPVAATSSANSGAATSASSGNATASSTSAPGTTGSTPEIVINLSGANGPTLDLNVDGSQIEISLANGSSGNSPSTIDLNFGGGVAAGSPIEISLGNGNSTNPSQTLGISLLA